jgi:osmotically-inducible protein OsmY
MTRRLTIRGARLGALLLLLATMAIAPAAGALEKSISDPWITAKVKLSLLTAEGLGAFDVNVDTNDGRVTLHGSVPSEAARAEVQRLARQVEGVREVHNLLQVVPASARTAVERSDRDVQDRVEAALETSPAFAGVKVASVNDGMVVLEGHTDTLSAHLAAIERARWVDGVRRVVSRIESPDRLADEEIWRDDRPSAGGPATALRDVAQDAWITTAAKVKLLTAEAPAFDINVDTRDGVVTLFGTVGSAREKANAEAAVKTLSGVASVRNQLQVVPPAEQAETERRDEDITAALERRLGDRDDLADAHIDVQVENGVARLTGKVRSQTDRLAALTVARTTEGVRSVSGDLEVQQN